MNDDPFPDALSAIAELIKLSRRYTATDWEEANDIAVTYHVEQICAHLAFMRLSDPLVAPDDNTRPTDLPPAETVPMHFLTPKGHQ